MKFFDDIVSAVVVAAVTVIFVAQTAATWPTPLQLHKFSLERDNPVAAFFSRSGEHRIALSSASD